MTDPARRSARQLVLGLCTYKDPAIFSHGALFLSLLSHPVSLSLFLLNLFFFPLSALFSTTMPSYSRALFLPLLALGAHAASNANACKGTCTHEILASRDTAAATVIISGPSHLVSDLTSAANWEMLDCPAAWPDKGSATVRLVCTAADPSESCAHVTEEGAVNTVVRMPASCGTGPFARIAAWDVSADQTISSSFAAKHDLREGAEVVEATLDYNFALIPESRGTVSFDIRAAHDPEIRKRMNTARDVPNVLRDIELQNKAHEAHVTGTATANHHVPTQTQTAYLNVPGADNDFGIPGIDLPSIDLPSIDLPSIDLPSIDLPSIDLPSIDLPSITIPDIPIPTLPPIDLPDFPDFPAGMEKSGGFHVLDFKKNVSLLSTSLGCHIGHIAFDASADISADMDMKVNAGYAFKIAGQLAPPKVTEFALAGVMSGQIKSTFAVDLYVEGDIILPPIKLLDLGIPGLSIPGIVNLGPQIALDLYVSLVLDVAISAKFPMTWDFERLDFVFPQELATPNNGQGQESKNTHSMQVNAAPGDITGNIGLHVMPKVT
ncbi:hypothetical protein EXIGLDRAFT_327124 [Exidia glandulosa HHB12029]|uniref:Uncharacterized protein n=1 Tax=Exidia glandulosa HHB12029 TaxID=1314781 RepID=A0A165LND7_EXIGL|nr:hypothetical protein EXIGLDRAFT_327124 [Exidia glandulosa HHB12029]